MVDINKPKGLKESFAKFFEDPSRETLRDLLKNHVGELQQLDFKEFWPETPTSLAKIVLAISNSGGGCVVFGVQNETGNPVGLAELKEETEWRASINKYVPEPLLSKVASYDFPFEASEYPALQGKKFQVLLIDDLPTHIPFISKAEGTSFRENTIYIRRGTACEQAKYEEIQKIIERRMATLYSVTVELELQDHIAQLKVLYKQIYRTISHLRTSSIANLGNFATMFRHAMGYEEIPNPKYPEEDFDDFILRAIDLKKERILFEIGVSLDK